ncbi:MAG TPA: divergent polysaccharide deacetylase family protein [Candidatus Lustribacter sp.]
MSKRRARRRQAPNPLVPFLLILIAAAAGWYLLRPLGHHGAHTTLAEHPSPTPSAAAVPSSGTTASPTPQETAVPSLTPSPSSTPSATPAAAPGGAKLALIIDDCGQWLPIERGFIALHVPLTLSVLPDVHGTAIIAREAHDAGKGVMLHLPMETVSGLYPGPGEVTTEMTNEQVRAQVESDLAQVPLAQGVNNHEGSKASADKRVMRDVMDVLANHGGLFFVDSRTTAASVGSQMATAAGVATASRDVFLDNKDRVAYTERQLREAAAIAERTGSAIAIGHPRQSTLDAVRDMIPQLQAQGITFVLAGSLTH